MQSSSTPLEQKSSASNEEKTISQYNASFITPIETIVQGFIAGNPLDLDRYSHRKYDASPDETKIIERYIHLVEQKEKNSELTSQEQVFLADSYLSGFNKQTEKKALEYYEKAAARDNIEGIRGVALIHTRGVVVPRNLEKAEELEQLVRQKGDLGDLVSYAANLDNDKKEIPKAIEIFKDAFAKGNHFAAWRLALIFYHGRKGVVEPDFEKAIFYTRIATAGYSFATGAMNTLAWMYLHGIGVKSDPTTAARLYEATAARNNFAGLSHLAYLYSKGLGVPLDLAKAKELFRKAFIEDGIHGFLYYKNNELKRLPEIEGMHYHSEAILKEGNTQLKALLEVEPELLYKSFDYGDEFEGWEELWSWTQNLFEDDVKTLINKIYEAKHQKQPIVSNSSLWAQSNESKESKSENQPIQQPKL